MGKVSINQRAHRVYADLCDPIPVGADPVWQPVFYRGQLAGKIYSCDKADLKAAQLYCWAYETTLKRRLNIATGIMRMNWQPQTPLSVTKK